MRVLRILGGVKYGIVYYIGFSTLIPVSPAEKRRLAGDGFGPFCISFYGPVMHIIKGQIYRLMRVLRILGGVKYGIVYYIGFSTLIPASPAEKRRLAGDGKYEKGAMPVEDMILTLLSKPNPNAPAKVVKR